jgi:hypothetical protein
MIGMSAFRSKAELSPPGLLISANDPKQKYSDRIIVKCPIRSNMSSAFNEQLLLYLLAGYFIQILGIKSTARVRWRIL